jgi:hypothetical protein
MKIIFSHDVDHLTVFEHIDDLIIPKFVARSIIEFSLCRISYLELQCRLLGILTNRWNNIDELISFDIANSIPSTFFLGVKSGKGMSYSLKQAKVWTERIVHSGFEVGVHGIAYDDEIEITNEHSLFLDMSGIHDYGIRMHYLRMSQDTLHLLNRAGYMFDTSVYEMKNPYKQNGIWEFPLHIMDSYIMCNQSSWQNQNLHQAQERTKLFIKDAQKKGIKYFTVLFHDRYFNDSFKTWKQWYIWLISYFRLTGYEFISYQDAIRELEAQ